MLETTIDVIVVSFFIVPMLLALSDPGEADVEFGESAGFSIVVALFLAAYGVYRRESFRLDARRTLVRYFVFMLGWVPLFIILYPYLVRLIGAELAPQKAVEYFASGPQGGGLWMSVAMVCVAAPVAEEILFRGILFRLMGSVANPATALVTTSVLFGLVHEPSVRIPVTFLGFLFGYLRLRSGGVGASILAHIVHNSLTVGAFLAWPELLEMMYEK